MNMKLSVFLLLAVAGIFVPASATSLLTNPDAQSFFIVFLLLLCIWLVWFIVHQSRVSYEFEWLSGISAPMVCLDHHGIIVASNEAADKILDVASRSVKGLVLYDLLAAKKLNTIQPTAKQGEQDLRQSTLYYSLAMPERLFKLQRTYQNRDFECLQFQDESEHCRYMEAQQVVQQLSTKSKLIASAMHEIGSPLAAIEGGLDHLCYHFKTSEEVLDKKYLLDVVEQLLFEARRVNNIKVEFSGLFRDSPEGSYLQDINALVLRACNLMSYDKRMSNIEVRNKLDFNISAIEINEGRLLQVLLNLLANAADALLESYWREDKTISVVTYSVNAELYIEVKDNGVGMDDEVLQQATNLFYSTKKEVKGSGLGLAICKDLIEQMGGQLRIDSNINEGTSVKLCFSEPKNCTSN